MAQNNQGQRYDPLIWDALEPNNIALNTIYQSSGLKLISVTMFWGVALKMRSFRGDDPTDVVSILRHGTKMNGVQWTPWVLENWLFHHCWPMGYSLYPTWKTERMRRRFAHVIELVHSANQARPPFDSTTDSNGTGRSRSF